MDNKQTKWSIYNGTCDFWSVLIYSEIKADD